MRTSSKKAKGRKLQDFVVSELRSVLPVSDGDIKPAIMGESGVDVKLSPLATTIFPFDIECKNQERWSVPQWWEQTISNTGSGRKPLLVVKRNRQEPLVVMRWVDFKEML